VSIEFALSPASAAEVMLTVMHTELCLLQPVAQKCTYNSHRI